MGARAMIDCICCGRCGKWATATGGGMCEACVVRETRDTEITALRAELAAAKERAKALETAVFDAHFRAFASRHYEYVGPGTTLDLLVADIGATQHERTALAAHVERLERALDPIARAYRVSMEPFAPGIDEADGAHHWMPHGWPSVADFKDANTALAATPAQSLAAHDAAVKVAVLDQIKARLYSLASKEQDQPYGYDMNPRQWAATCLECAAEDVTAMQDEIISEADRIEKEGA